MAGERLAHYGGHGTMKRSWPRLLRIGVGAILIAYGLEKLADPVAFLKAIHEYQILPSRPPWMMNLMPNGIPILEIGAGLCLITGFLRRGASLVMGCFLTAFTAAILWRTFRVMEETGLAFQQVQFDCGCGSGVVVIWEKILFNLALIVATFYAGFRRTTA